MSSSNNRRGARKSKSPVPKGRKSAIHVGSPTGSKKKGKGGANANNGSTRARHISIQTASAGNDSPGGKNSKLRNRSIPKKNNSKKKSLVPAKAPALAASHSAQEVERSRSRSEHQSKPKNGKNSKNGKNAGNKNKGRKSQLMPTSPTKPRRSVDLDASGSRRKQNKKKSDNMKKRKSAMMSAEATKKASKSNKSSEMLKKSMQSKSVGVSASVTDSDSESKHLTIRPIATEDITTKIYARVRRLMPWEPNRVSVKIMGNQVQNKTSKTMNEYSFSKVFTPQDDNEKVFKSVVLPMVSNVLQGFNAVLIAYGQTGSGKTYSMLGKPKQNVVGLLPMMLEYMVQYKSVTSVQLSAVEAFAYHVAKIELFDLFDDANQTQVWADKKGNTSLNMLEATTVDIQDAQDAHDKIIRAHAASHFAPTGKNPESSRGHVTFVAKVTQQQSSHTKLVSYFVFVDCAGSEGESAFTPDFIAAVSKEALMARRLEAGCINTGLSQLQIIFNELRVKGELNATLGNGLRRVLHPYINTQTFLSVLFALSPSVNNQKATESTLKFAVTAGMVKVKPVQKKGVLDFDTIVKELREHIARQEKEMEMNNDTIEDLTNQIERARIVSEQMKICKQRDNGTVAEYAGYAADELDDQKIEQLVKQRMQGRDHKRVSSDVPLDVAAQLVQMDEEEKRVENEFGRGGGKLPILVESPSGAVRQASSSVSSPNPDVPATSGQSAFDELKAKLANRRTSQQPVDLEKFSKFEKIRTTSWQKMAKETINFVEMDQNVNKAVEEDYKSLKARKGKIKEMSEEELRMYAGELQSLFMQEEITYKGLAMSTGAIIDFLHGEYEGMLKFFQVRKILPKEMPQFDNNLIM